MRKNESCTPEKLKSGPFLYRLNLVQSLLSTEIYIYIYIYMYLLLFMSFTLFLTLFMRSGTFLIKSHCTLVKFKKSIFVSFQLWVLLSCLNCYVNFSYWVKYNNINYYMHISIYKEKIVHTFIKRLNFEMLSCFFCLWLLFDQGK